MIRFIFYAAAIFFIYRYFKKMQKRNEENIRLSKVSGYYIDYYIALKEEDKEQFKKYMDKGTEKAFKGLLKIYKANKKINFSKLPLNLKRVIDSIRIFGMLKTLEVRLNIFNNLDKDHKNEILNKISDKNRDTIKVIACRYKIDKVINIEPEIYKNAVPEFIEATNGLVREYVSMRESLLEQHSFVEANVHSHIRTSTSGNSTDFYMPHNNIINNDMLAMQITGMIDPPPMMVMDAFGSGMHEIGSADLSSPYDMPDFGMDGGMHEFGVPDMSSPMDSGFDNNMF